MIPSPSSVWLVNPWVAWLREAYGVRFHFRSSVGAAEMAALRKDFDAQVLCMLHAVAATLLNELAAAAAAGRL